MPVAAYGVLAVFTASAIAAGLAAWWLLAPRLPLGPLLPILAAFVALYLSGHRLGLRFGPMVELFGFQVALLFDLALALLAAGAVAAIARLVSGVRA